MNPDKINARLVMPISPYNEIIKGYKVDLFLYANNVVLYCFSKKWMCCDTAGCVIFNCLAAVVKFKVLHTVRNVFVR